MRPKNMKNTTASANLISLLLMLLLASQVVATDMYLPALPQIANDLSSSIGQVQWTLTAYIISFGFMQLVAGTISDRYGRRRTLLWGLAIYTLAGILGAGATSLPFLLLSRVVQGAATAAAVISARAIIRDQYSGAAGLGIMARSMTGMSVIGVLAPVFGGLVTEYVGWHITMAMIAVCGVLTWCTVFFYFTENHAVKEQDISVTAMHFMTHQKSLFSSLLAGFSYSGAIAFLMLSPILFIGQFGMSRVAYGVLPAFCSLAFRLSHGVVNGYTSMHLYGGSWFSSAVRTRWCGRAISRLRRPRRCLVRLLNYRHRFCRWPIDFS